VKTWTPETLPRTLTVRVTAEDIEHGRRGDCESCPIAKALHRCYPLRNSYWQVGGTTALATRTAAVFWLSPRTIAFIATFDYHATAEPATFRLRRAS
jgi:hypothetical protein